MNVLRAQVARGVGLSGVSAVVTAAAQILQMVILARLLGPEVFGLMAIVIVIVSLADLFGQMGMHEALIARQDVSPAEYSSLYWFGLGWGAVTYIVFVALTPLIAFLIDVGEIGRLLPIALTSVLIAPLGNQFLARAQKSMNFGLIAWAEIASAFAGLAVAVFSAWIWNQGVMALIWGHLSRVVIRTAVLAAHGWIVGPRPALHFRTDDLRGYLSFGLYRVAAMSVNLLNSRIDQILIGGLLGVQALGFYSLAVNLTLLPMQMINPIVTRVAFPAFAKVANDIPILRRGYLQLLQLLTFANAPALIGIAAVAPVAIPEFLGEQWQEAVPLIQILAIYTLLRSVGNASGSLILGQGRADITFFWNLGLLVAVPPVVYLASLAGSLVHIAWSMVALQAVLYWVLYAVIIRTLLGPCLVPFVGAVAVPIGLALAMGAVVIGLDPLFVGLPPGAHLGGMVIAGVFCFIALTLVFRRRELKRIMRLAKGDPWDLQP